MKTRVNRITAMALALFLALAALPGACFTASAAEYIGAIDGTDETWRWNTANDTIYIAGTGAIDLANFRAAVAQNPMGLSPGSIRHVVVEEGVTKLQDTNGVFYGAETLTIPNSLSSFTKNLFYKMTNLRQVIVGSGNANYKSGEDGSLYSRDGKRFIGYPRGRRDAAVTVADGTQTIEYCAFSSCGSITSITLPESLRTLESNALYNMRGLQTVYLPSAVDDIKYRALESLPSLTAITVSSSNSAYKSVNGVLLSGDGKTLVKYPAANTRTRYAAPDTVQTIEGYAFEDAKNITTLTLPEGLQKLGDRSLFHASAVQTLRIPSSVRIVQRSAFDCTDSLTAITVDAENASFCDVDGVLMSKDGKTLIRYPEGRTQTSYTVPDGVEEIGEFAFGDADRLQNIVFPSSLRKMGRYPFFNTRIPEIILPEGITELGKELFRYSGGLQRVHIPTTVTSISSDAFLGVSCVLCTEYANEVVEAYAALHGLSTARCDGHGAHVHRYTSTVTKAATCTVEGVRTFACKCGDRRTEPIAPLGHAWYSASITQAATCTESGVCTYTCIRCRENRTEEIAPTGHEWNKGKVTTEPTCTEDGVNTVTCRLCGESRTEPIAPLGHDYVETDVFPTCTEGGYAEFVCDRCGDSYRTDETDPLGHAWNRGKVTIQATCTEHGERIVSCARCGETDAVVIAALGHRYAVSVIEPTCLDGGCVLHKCSRCADEFVTGETDPLGHDYMKTVVDPTCTEAGYTLYTCSRCGDAYTSDETNPLGHDWDGGIVFREATAAAEGEMLYTCKRCGSTKTETIAPVPAEGLLELSCDKTVGRGQMLAVTVQMRNNPGVTAMQLALDYDPAVLELVEVRNGSVFDDGELVTGLPDAVPFGVQWVVGSAGTPDAQNNASTGTLVTFIFCVRLHAPVRRTQVTVTYDENNVFDVRNQNVPFAVHNAAFYVIPYRGDVNGDGKVDLKDLTILRRWKAGWQYTIDEEQSDVNEDGKINLKDVVALADIMVGGSGAA